jgi:hypothetical protein
MDDFLEKLLKIQSEFFKRMRLLFILDLLSIFSISYALFIIFQAEYFLQKTSLYPQFPVALIPPVLAFIIAIIGAFLLHRKDRKKNVTLLTENKYPDLKEKLRTAYDNRDETNVIVDSLKSLVSELLTGVSASKLLSGRVVATKIILVIIFISLAALVSFNPDYRVPPDTLNNFSTAVTGTIANTTGGIFTTGPPVDTTKAGKTGQGDIFGKPDIAPIQGKPVDLTLNQGQGLGNTPSEYKPDQNQFIKSAAFPVDVLGSNVSDGGYSTLMGKTQTEKDLINKYAEQRSNI